MLAVGTWLAAHPDAAWMVRDGGHDLGNHTWSHPALAGYAAEPMYAEIERCRDKLVELTGSPGAFFRQSQGQHATGEELTEAGRAGYSTVLSYDVDSLDWKDPGPAAIRAAVAKATAGSVVSMHLGHPGTVAALPGVLADLAARGLTRHRDRTAEVADAPATDPHRPQRRPRRRLHSGPPAGDGTMQNMPGMDQPTGVPREPTPPAPALNPLPEMPAVTDPHDVDAAAGPGMLSPAVAGDRPLVYVPHSKSGDVWVIDPLTYQVVAKYPVGKELKHVVPSWDLHTLYATDDRGDQVLPFDPRTGRPGTKVPVVDCANASCTRWPVLPRRSPRRSACGLSTIRRPPPPQSGPTVFGIAFVQWISGGKERSLFDIAADVLGELVTLTGGAAPG